MLKEIVRNNRTYRRFYQDAAIGRDTLEELVDLARLSSCGSNLQSLKYYLSNDEETNAVIFRHLRWAGYYRDWDGPEEGERPSAYIVMLGDSEIATQHFWDHGIACQSILLGATEKGFGGCMFAAVDKKGLAEALQLPERYEMLVVIALGKPKETVQLEEITDPKNVKYWRDADGVHHVPKRKLADLLLN